MYVSTRTAALAVTLTIGVGAALSQPSSAQSASSPAPTSSAGSALIDDAPRHDVPLLGPPFSGHLLGYRSAFEGYRAYSEQPVRSWRESNDTVGRIGGGQSQAREERGGSLAGSAPETNGMENRPGVTGKSEEAGKSEKAGKARMPGMPGMSAMPGMSPDHGGMKMPGASTNTPASTPPAVSTPRPAKVPIEVPARQAHPSANSASASMPGDHAGHQQP